MPIFCGECGAKGSAGGERCACGKTVGVIDTVAEVWLPFEGKFPVPNVCCCCLNRSTVTRKHKYDLGVNNPSWTFPVPWCSPCVGRSRVYKVVCGLGAVGFGLAGYALSKGLGLGDSSGWTIGITIVAALVGLFVAMSLVIGNLPSLNLAGHARSCDALVASISKKTDAGAVVRLSFRNRAFARQWNRMLTAAGIPGAPESGDRS